MRRGTRSTVRIALVAACALAAGLLVPAGAWATVASTTTSAPSALEITLGGSASDAATVTGTAVPPSGTVTFYACGPLTSASDCASGGQQVGSAVPLTASLTDATATATSDSFTPTAAGTWCFRAEYSGDDTYDPSNDGGADECVLVDPASSSASSAPQDASIGLGDQNSDSATITGNSAGGAPTGNVTFSVCGPLSNADGCASGGQMLGSVAVSGSGDAATATSPGFTPASPGTWCFRADYGGDDNYNPSSDGSSDECFTVAKATSATGSVPAATEITLGDSNSDQATVTGGSAGGTPTGNVTFLVCGPMSNPDGCSAGGQEIGTESLSGSGDEATASSPSFTPTAPGVWCFASEYLGDGNYKTSGDTSGDQCFTVDQAASSTSSSPGDSAITLGQSTTDDATVTGIGVAPTGKVTFAVCGPLSTPQPCTTGGTAVGTATLQAGSGSSASATSPSFTPDAPGVWCFSAQYSGDQNYKASGDGGTGECFTVNKVTPSVISSPGSASTTLNAGEPDTATVIGNATSGRPTGTVSFFICGPLASAAGCPTGGQQIGGPVTLQPAGTDTSTASSPTFKPTSAGTWCFRAEYSGDASYGAATSPSGSGECFTVPEPGHPSATISSPHPSAIYGLGQTVDASYSCAEASGGPGMAACTGNAANGSPINTSTLGPHTFSVTALSQDGLSTTVSTGYTVAAPPVVSIKSPADGASYTRGQSVPVTVSCSEGKFGTGLSSFCLGPTSINTMKVGTFAYTVTVTSTDGLRTSRTVHYRVVLPSNQFTVSNLRGHNHGRVTLTAALPGRGQVKLVEKASRSGLRPPRPGTFVFASLHIAVPGKKRVQLDVMPGPRGKTLLQLHRSARINVLVTYTPTYGMSRTITFRRVRVTR